MTTPHDIASSFVHESLPAKSVKIGGRIAEIPEHQAVTTASDLESVDVNLINVMASDQFNAGTYLEYSLTGSTGIHSVREMFLMFKLNNSSISAIAIPVPAMLLFDRVELLVGSGSSPIWSMTGVQWWFLISRSISADDYVNFAADMGMSSSTRYQASSTTIAAAGTRQYILPLNSNELNPVVMGNWTLGRYDNIRLRFWFASRANLGLADSTVLGPAALNITQPKLKIKRFILHPDEHKARLNAAISSHRYFYPKWFSTDTTLTAGSVAQIGANLSTVSGEVDAVYVVIRPQNATGTSLINWASNATSAVVSHVSLRNASGEFLGAAAPSESEWLLREGKMGWLNGQFAATNQVFVFNFSSSLALADHTGQKHGTIMIQSTDRLEMTVTTTGACQVCVFVFSRGNVTSYQTGISEATWT